jgi:hypothetical protein
MRGEERKEGKGERSEKGRENSGWERHERRVGARVSRRGAREGENCERVAHEMRGEEGG